MEGNGRGLFQALLQLSFGVKRLFEKIVVFVVLHSYNLHSIECDACRKSSVLYQARDSLFTTRTSQLLFKIDLRFPRGKVSYCGVLGNGTVLSGRCLTTFRSNILLRLEGI